MVEYKNKLTLDGRLRPQAGVTAESVREVRSLVESALAGDLEADARLRTRLTRRSEAITTTSDIAPSLAQLINLNFIPQFDEAERVWSKIATVREVPDFRPAVLYSMFGDLEGAGIEANGAAATVPEATPYPHVTITGQESAYSKLAKRGFRTDYTWETSVNDTAGFISGIPQEMLGVAVDTEEAEVFEALINGTGAASELDGGTLPDGTVVPINAPLSPAAIWQAIREYSIREVNGKKIGRASRFVVVVPTGTKDFIDYQLRLTIISIQDGAITYGVGDQSALAGIEIVESPFVTGTNWYLLPAPGSVRRPVLELLRLRGYATPELRAREGGYSFETDTAAFRFRYVVGGANWFPDTFIVHSEGDGNA